VRNAVKQLDSPLPVYGLKTLESQLDEILLTERLIALLSGRFGLLHNGPAPSQKERRWSGAGQRCRACRLNPRPPRQSH
jgi:hypothetical protein